MNKVKVSICLALALVVCASLVGCMNAGNRENEVPNATEYLPNATGGPRVTGAPLTSPGPSPAATGGVAVAPFDWGKSATDVEGKINKISEVKSSRVVTTGTTALVGVEFTAQYKGEMTERIRNMIAGEVMAADPMIQTVAVTAEPADVAKINQLADKIKAGTPSAQLEQEIDSIMRNVTTLK